MTAKNTLSVAHVRDRLAALTDEASAAGQRFIDARYRHAQAVRTALHTNDHATTTKTAAAVDNAKRAHDRAAELVAAAELALGEAKARERDAAEKAARQHIEATLAEMAASAREADQLFASAAGILERLRLQEAALHRFVRGEFGISKSPSASPLVVAEAGTGFGVFLRSIIADNRTDARPWTADAVAAATGNIQRGLAQ